MTTCQGKSGNQEPWYYTPYHTLVEFTKMMCKFGGCTWMTSYRTTPTLSQSNQVFHSRIQQPQLTLIANQLSQLKPVHIFSSCWWFSSKTSWGTDSGDVSLNINNEHLMLLLLPDLKVLLLAKVKHFECPSCIFISYFGCCTPLILLLWSTS